MAEKINYIMYMHDTTELLIYNILNVILLLRKFTL